METLTNIVEISTVDSIVEKIFNVRLEFAKLQENEEIT
jgi:hypothetical protein